MQRQGHAKTSITIINCGLRRLEWNGAPSYRNGCAVSLEYAREMRVKYELLHNAVFCNLAFGNIEFMGAVRKRWGEICTYTYGLEPLSEFTTVHNYIDHDSNIIRKGAVSAKDGEMLLIPINMRDGSLLCRGKGNPDWNYSAPHGAGRLFSRGAAFHEFTLEEYERTMREAGIYSTTVDGSTLDECPMAYKGMKDIVDNIAPTAEIIKILKPIYNFKATRPKSLMGDDSDE